MELYVSNKKRAYFRNFFRPESVLQTVPLLQKVFDFYEPYECFIKFRLVSKLWMNAIDTTRFSGKSVYDIEHAIRSCVVTNEANEIVKFQPQLLKRIVQSLQSFVFYQWKIKFTTTQFEMIQNSIHNLIQLEFFPNQESLKARPIIENCRKTLVKCIIMNQNLKDTLLGVEFLKLENLQIEVSKIPLEDMKTLIENIGTKMSTLKTLELWIPDYENPFENHPDYVNFIFENLLDHCIVGQIWHTYALPLKMVYGSFGLWMALSIDEMEEYVYYAAATEYIHVYAWRTDTNEIVKKLWEVFQTYLPYFTNLKAICISKHNMNDIKGWHHVDVMQLMEENNIWTEMIQYFEVHHENVDIISKELWDEKISTFTENKWQLKFSENPDCLYENVTTWDLSD